MNSLNKRALTAIVLTDDDGTQLADGTGDVELLRRLTHLGYRDSNGNIVAGSEKQYIQFYTLGATSSDNGPRS